MPMPPLLARALMAATLNDEDQEMLLRVRMNDAGHGYDAFGMHKDFVGLGMAMAKPLYAKYFRVKSFGAEKIPDTGPAILAANHSGTIPVDGMMLWADVIKHTGRIPRAIADHFVPTLPIVGTFFSRGGMVGGSRGNARSLLNAGEILMIFPEGTAGVGKHFSQRYQLQPWRVGHAELAIRHRAPVVPVAFIGPEEQMPQVLAIKSLGKLFGLPYLPVPATPVPLPVRYRIHYGDPVDLPSLYKATDADDPEAVKEAAAKVEVKVKELIAHGLRERGGRLFT
ncbi:MAG: lysophospholipid acyltransferase family protein [Myxococcota bacterium]|nr:lysophospholipid acyltransferase family protein [Myxococcota bacterium]